MTVTQAGPIFLVIGTHDDFLHVYQSEQELLEDHAIGAGEGERSGPVEFFDSAGHRLCAKYDRQWRLAGLTRTAEAADPDLVRKRVHNALDYVRRYIESSIAQANPQDVTVSKLVARVLDLQSADLDTCLKALVHSEDDHQDEPSEGIVILHRTNDPLHNWLHGAGWQL